MEKTAPIDVLSYALKTGKNISTEEALKDVTPIDWGEDVLSGKKRVYISETEICVK